MSTMLSAEDQRRVLSEARRAVAETLAGRQPAPPPAEGVFARRAGVFVSFHQHGELRGCIGYVEADRPLADLVGRFAIAAATGDPRFPPITAAELESRATSKCPCSARSSRLRIRQISSSAVTGWSWSSTGIAACCCRRWPSSTAGIARRFLSHTCVKAGLPRDAWKTGARIFRFEAEVFGERSHGDAARVMDIYLVPVGAERYELYCEVDDHALREGDDSRSAWRRKASALFHRMLQYLEDERRRRLASAAADPRTRWQRLRDRVLAWLAERVAEQRLLWHLRSQTAATVAPPRRSRRRATPTRSSAARCSATAGATCAGRSRTRSATWRRCR